MTHTADSASPIDEHPDDAPRDPRESGRSSAARFARDVLVIVLAAILISFLVKTFLVRSFYIPSSSMESTLIVDDRIIVNELEPELVPISRGDVVVFTDPGGWLPASPTDTRNGVQVALDGVLSVVGLSAPDSNDHLIKRVIGVPGDHVTCCGNFGSVSVNGVPLDEPYIELPDGATDSAPSTFDITVPDGKLWVMGDNRYHSADSLNHYSLGDAGGGFVPIDDVVGRAMIVTWPLDRWAVLGNYPVTFAGVTDAEN
jgi:signal peptidase I